MVSLFVVALSMAADPAPCPIPPQSEPPILAQQHKFNGPIEKIRQRAAELALPGSGSPEPPGSFLWQPTYELDFCLRGPTRPYAPQPGDIVLSTDTSQFWIMMHHLAGTSHPTHSMIVFALPDGKMGILEGGPHDTMKCRILDALPHMYSYEREGRIWVRRRAVPLTPEQSCRLTEFALAADMRQFAIGRLAEQLTPFRTRGPIKTAFVGKPHGLDRESYFCSELVTEACVYAGLLDANTTRPSATYPRDLFMDHSLNPYINKHLKLYPCWDPPARWTSFPSECPVASAVGPR